MSIYNNNDKKYFQNENLNDLKNTPKVDDVTLEMERQNYEAILEYMAERNSNNFRTTDMSKYLQTLEGYESLLNIPSLFTKKDKEIVEENLTHTKEYNEYIEAKRNFIETPCELNKEYEKECFEKLQDKITKIVMEVYQERLEQYREAGGKAKDIDEIAVSFDSKNETWTFTPLHIEEDGSKSIAACSCKISLDEGFNNSYRLDFDEYRGGGPGNPPGGGGAAGAVNVAMQELEYERVVVRDLISLQKESERHIEM